MRFILILFWACLSFCALTPQKAAFLRKLSLSLQSVEADLISPSILHEHACLIEPKICTMDPKLNSPATKLIRTPLQHWGIGFEDVARFVDQMTPEPIIPGPQQIHLSLTGNPTQMTVMWVDSEIESNPRVQYNGQVSPATRSTYDAGVFGWSGWIYTALMSNLTNPKGTDYKVGGDDSMSDSYHFDPIPTSPNSQSQYTFAVWADQGTYIPAGWAVIDRVYQDYPKYNFDLLLHQGDLCYAGTGEEDEFEEVWDVWVNLIQPIATLFPFQTTVGNHEKYYNYTSFRSRFLMNGQQSGGEHNFWFSYVYGNVFFVSISTEHPYAPGSPQYKWLIQQFEKSRQMRNTVPWLIVMGHRAMYCSDEAEWSAHSPGGQLQTTLESVFRKYNVNLYLCGHSHMYERVYPVYNGTVIQGGNIYNNPGATVHVVQATAGVFLDEKYHNPQPVWSASRQNRYGYGKMTTTSNSLNYQFIHQDDGSVLDQFTINI